MKAQYGHIQASKQDITNIKRMSRFFRVKRFICKFVKCKDK